jgi:tRNA 2-thiouridine synthesizing protein A
MARPFRISNKIDIREEICPLSFVRTKIQLEDLKRGERLEVLARDGEQFKNVTRSLKDEGHKILCINQLDDGSVRLVVEKGEG